MSGTSEQHDFLVRRDRLDDVEFRSGGDLVIPPQGALLRIERFSFGANNITYGMLGDAVGYWNLFPAPEGWGRIPVWGFGEVIRSEHSGLKAGERMFGAFPMSTHVILEPTDIKGKIFRDSAPHRQRMPAAYNEYMRITDDPAFAGVAGDHQLLLRWQFMPAFLMHDFLSGADFFGARTVIISSASSKTAISLAHLLCKSDIRIIGLTSEANKSFVEKIGYYNDVLAYDEIEALPRDPSVFIDMAGNSKTRAVVHTQLGDALKYSCRVGLTHRDAGRDQNLPGPKPVWFNTAEKLRKRLELWGRESFNARYAGPWQEFSAGVDRWLEIVRGSGREDVEAMYRDVLSGRTPPSKGYILSLGD